MPIQYISYLDEVFENLEEAILVIRVEPDNNYRLVQFNKAASAMSGYKQDNIGKLVKDIVPKEGYADVSKRYEEVIRTRQTLEYTRWSEVPIGKEAYSIKLVPILNALGECSLIVGISKHITPDIEREKQSETIIKSLEAITETMPSLTAVVDIDSQILYLSKQLSSLLYVPGSKHKPKTQQSNNFTQYISKTDTAKFFKAMKDSTNKQSSTAIINIKTGKKTSYLCTISLHETTARYVLRLKPLDSVSLDS